jgi:hypothetical protein
MPHSQNHYTAAQIARALHRSKWGVAKALQNLPSTITAERRTRAWSLGALPEGLCRQLEAEAKRRGCDGIEALLAASSEPWQPKIPLADLAPHCLEHATKLQRAFAPVIARLSELKGGELEAFGVECNRREFKRPQPITARHWRELWALVRERDAGAENWNRIELYLPKRLARKNPVGALVPAATEADFNSLSEFVGLFNDQVNPKRDEITAFWCHTFNLFDGLIEEGRQPKRLKKNLLRFLSRYGWLAQSANALRMSFERRWQRWLESGGTATALVDGRAQKRGEERASPYDPESLDRIKWHASRNCGGRIAQAVRELADENLLDPQIVRALMTSANKSYVPARLREAVKYDVANLIPYHRGPRAVDEATASISRHYNGIWAMRVLMADDFTLPVYFWIPDGNGGFLATRGQCLLVMDFRTLRVLGYCLMPDKQYNSQAIRTVFTRVFAERGLPQILYLERGIWKTSRLITGRRRALQPLREEQMPMNWAECETGLGQFGIKFIHAIRARSKPIERVGGLLQDLMEGEQGYCGRDERRDCPERTRLALLDVASRRVHPSKHFYSQEQWEARLHQIVERYNAAPQNGKQLNGLSPDQAFEQLQNTDDPVTRFDGRCRYLLAHHRLPVEVKQDGIIFRLCGQTYRYFGEETSAWRGHQMIAWFNPELPEVLTVTDKEHRNAFTVARSDDVSAMAALTGETDSLSRELARAQAHNARPKTLYRVLSVKFRENVRSIVIDRVNIKLGETIERETARIQTARRAQLTNAERVQRKAVKVGVPGAILNKRDDVERGLDLIAEAKRLEGQGL